MADLAAKVGSDEKRLSRTIVRINTIESTSPHAVGDNLDEVNLPTALIPSEPESPDKALQRSENRGPRARGHRVAALARAQVVGLYYYNDATMKDIGAEIGVNESARVGSCTRAPSSACASRSAPRPSQVGRAHHARGDRGVPAEAEDAQGPAGHGAQLGWRPARARRPSRAWARMPVAMAAEKPARGRARREAAAK